MGKKGKDQTTDYAKAVVSGVILAGPMVRLACQRHLNDIEAQEDKGLIWDAEAGERVIEFFRVVLRLNGGEFEGEPFELHESQKFIVGSLFGWKNREDGYRRFRVAFVEVAKGNGKSPLAAGIGIYMLVADKEPRAEIYAAAVDKDQAQILFRDAVAMVDQSPALNKRIQRSGGRGREWNLAFLEADSFFRPISSEHIGGRGKSGPRPHCALLDEVHEHPSDSMVEFMRAGTKGRRQALIFMITNSGSNRNSVCYSYHEYARRILEGSDQNEAFFGFVCGLDENDEWTNPEVWPKANPLLGVSITEKYIQEQVREAQGMPSKQSLVRRLNFCEWTDDAERPLIAADIWKSNGGAVPDLRGRMCYGGLDLAAKNDLTALVLVFPLEDGKKAVLPFFWTPADTVQERQERDRVPYDHWIRSGHLIAVPGRSIDYGFVAHKIAELTKLYEIEAVAFDPWRIDDLERELDAIGVNIDLYSHSQGFKEMSPALEALEDEALKGNLLHGNHPVLTSCVANAVVSEDPAGNRKFNKKRATTRIDGAVALAMALNLCALKPGEGFSSVYEDESRGVASCYD